MAVKKNDPDELVIPFFKRKDLACPCCGKLEMPQATLDFISRVRNYLGKAMILNSAYRCPMHNASAKVRGTKNSSHVRGLAIDVHIPNDAYRYLLLQAAFECGVKGVGIYPHMIHLDIDETRPSKRASWVSIPPAQKA